MGVVLTNSGKAMAAGRMKGQGTEPLKCNWGTGAGDAAETDTGLSTEASESRVTGTSSLIATTVTGDTYRVVATQTCAGAGKAITNVALFDDAGNIYIKASFAGVVLAAGDRMQFTFNHQFN
jgi:hypothetical protein